MSLAMTAACGLLALIAAMAFFWALSLPRKDASIVDRIWGLTFVLQAWVYAFASGVFDWRKILVLAFVSIWGIRLSWHIHSRNRGHGEDYRYASMRAEHGARFWWYSFFSVFLLQGGLSFLIGAPLLMIMHNQSGGAFSPFDALGILLWCIGFYFEAVGDLQLKRFKRDPANKGKLLTTGLWSLTRHPNYFGDATLWWGYYGFALAVPGGTVTFFGPVIMTWFIRDISGAKLLEKDLSKKKPGYDEYVRDTPMFVPRLSAVLSLIKRKA